MTQNPRICPSCQRRVPPHVGQCRCGYAFPAVADAGELPEIHAEPTRPWLGPTLALVVVVVAIAFYMTRSSQPAPAVIPASVPAPAGRPAAAAPQASAAASSPMRVPLPTTEAPALPLPVPPSAMSFEDIIGNASAAVVSIETPAGRGSGFFVAPDLVITNAHVVEDNSSVTLRMSDGGSAAARVLRTSPEVDIAIVRVNQPKPGQPTMAMGTVNGARAGQEVIAIGSPLGMLQNTVTRGIVSAVRNAGGVILIQTDAAINRGNSGGPLIDRTGKVIGITTLKMASNSESLGFAVAIDHARPLLEGRAAELVAPGAGGSQPTPLSGAFGTARSQTDVMRDEGAAQFERVLQAAARRADSLDDYWTRFRNACRATVAPNGGDREWFGVWDRPPSFNTADAQCTRWLSDITEMAGVVRTAMASADETARTASVYPGVRRELRRKYKLDWDGWER